MKMVKSLLLGSAAGLVAVAGAQAADLPVKAKPVQYVKICSLYGAGFYYIPGTDSCLKDGGWGARLRRMGSEWKLTNGSLATGQNSTRATQNLSSECGLHHLTVARNQTEYGTLRMLPRGRFQLRRRQIRRQLRQHHGSGHERDVVSL